MSKKPTWLSEKGLQQFFAATVAAGGEARAVGGAVRDFLLDVEGGDVDLASTLTPEKTMALAAANGWKAIPTGIEHGTVTLVLPERVVEVTTLRRDVETDGRHAVVAYTDNWQEDAARRDFTINALYMDAAGEVFDFFDGKKDIEMQRVAFIGDADARIKEDGLRMLRYFRFLASHGKPPADEAALQAIKDNVAMLDQLSGERIAAEMKKLLSVANPAFVLRLMVESGVAARVFPREITPSVMIRLHMLETQADYQTSVWARVVALLQATPHGTASAVPAPPQGGSKEEKDPGAWISDRWKLARHESKQLQQLVALPALDGVAAKHVHTRVLRLHGAPTYLDGLLLQAALKPGMDVAPYVALAHEFVAPTFPITAKDLKMPEGKALGDRLRLLETKWEESDYALTKEQLLK